MTVLKLLTVFVFGGLLTACIFEDVQKLKNDSRLLRDFLKASPVATHCSQPGRDQDIVCNYKLVIWNVAGEVYRGHVDPKLVEEGIRACNELKKQSTEDSDLYVIMKHSECPTVQNYRYNVYEFKIAGPAIPENENPVDLVNVPHGTYMRKGHIGYDESANRPLAR
jgi:hypothetical protein